MPPKLRVFINFLAENLPSVIKGDENDGLTACRQDGRLRAEATAARHDESLDEVA
jgi:hypothetical protein